MNTIKFQKVEGGFGALENYIFRKNKPTVKKDLPKNTEDEKVCK